jgi:uncharacterized protein
MLRPILNFGLVFGTFLPPLVVARAAEASPDYPIQPVPLAAVRVNDAFWSPRMETNCLVTIPWCFKQNEETGRLDNFRKAAHLMSGPFRGRRFDDTDIYKAIEAAAFSLETHPDAALEREVDAQIELIAKAQEPDGYLFTARTIDPAHPAPGIGPERWSRLNGSHELYNLGHLMEAAGAHFQATGKRSLLDVALKSADLLCATFGPQGRHDVPGHEEVEIGLVKLYRVTGQKKYLDLAKFFLDQRGHPHDTKPYGAREAFAMFNDPIYRQDNRPVLEQTEAEGHAVRAMYLYTAMADVGALTGEPVYAKAIDRLWDNVTGKKISVTGGVGANAETEGFSRDYILPNEQSCNETCAAIGGVFWNQRLFQLQGEAKYIDVLERVLYNALIAGVSQSGDRFFYENPLAADGRFPFNHGSRGRAPWFGVACCPANVARFMAQFPEYIYAQNGDSLYVNLFVGSETDVQLNNRKVHVKQETKYPFGEDIKVTLEPAQEGEFTVNVRVPGWAQNQAMPSALYAFQFETSTAGSPQEEPVVLKVNGRPETLKFNPGFASIRRTWKKGDTIELHLPMRPRRLFADPRVAADKGRLAIQCGPLVYCAEGIDNEGKVLDREMDVRPGRYARMIDKPGDPIIHPESGGTLTAEFRAGLLGGITVVKGRWADGADLTAVPYYAWNNRGNGEMCVWFKTGK